MPGKLLVLDRVPRELASPIQRAHAALPWPGYAQPKSCAIAPTRSWREVSTCRIDSRGANSHGLVMHDPHQVLGVRSGAADEEIKAAFRRLAKQLHPDLHPPDPGADQRFQEIVGAYETLSGLKSRAVYDAGVASHHARRRQQFRTKAATMAITFALTVCSVPVAMHWRELRELLMPAPEYFARLPDNEPRELPPQPPPQDRFSEAPSVQSGVRAELPQNGYGLGPSDEPDVHLGSRIRSH